MPDQAVPRHGRAGAVVTREGDGGHPPRREHGGSRVGRALPLDYDEPTGEQVQIAVAKVPATDPANRVGSLFFNFGGPGGPAVDYLQAAGAGLFATPSSTGACSRRCWHPPRPATARPSGRCWT